MSTIVFDGDETLWFSCQEYDRASTAFLDYLQNILPYDTPVSRQYIADLYVSIDRKNAQTWGIRRGRIAQSMVDTYKHVCKQIENLYGRKIYGSGKTVMLRMIGDRPFEFTKHPWAPGAEEMLAELQKRGHTLCLYSKYDKEVWSSGRAEYFGVHRFIDPQNVLLTDTAKTVEDFNRIARVSEDPDGDFIAVGNSADDLIPVTKQEDPRWRGFYIPIPTTSPLEAESSKKHDEPELYLPSVDHDRVTTVKRVTDILQCI